MKIMWGIEYYYSDQFVRDQWLYPMVFTSRKEAQAYIDTHENRWYLSIKEMQINPEPKESK